jgi:1-acyl-sn-glycerol-3-phosphate acyltransferase
VGFLLTHTPVAVAAEVVRPGRGHAARIASRGAGRMMRALGVRFEVRGAERIPPGSCVFAANHRSHFDIPALLAALPSGRFAAKQELFRQPVLGAAMRALGVIPIDREHPEVAKRALELAARQPGGGSLVIFPEGEEAEPGQMLPFKAGAFVFALRTGLPVVPVAIHNSAAILARGDALAISPGRVVVEVLDPIETGTLGVDDRARLAAETRATLERALRPCDGGAAERADLGPF